MNQPCSGFDPGKSVEDQMIVYVHGLQFASGTQVLLLVFSILKEWQNLQGWKYRYHPIDRVYSVITSVLNEVQNGNPKAFK